MSFVIYNKYVKQHHFHLLALGKQERNNPSKFSRWCHFYASNKINGPKQGFVRSTTQKNKRMVWLMAGRKKKNGDASFSFLVHIVLVSGHIGGNADT